MRVDPEQGAIGDLSQYARRVADWKAVARYPDLVSHVYLMTAGESARLQARRLNASSREFEPVEWPERLLPWTDALSEPASAAVAAPVSSTFMGDAVRGWRFEPEPAGPAPPGGEGLDRRRVERRGDSKQDSAGPGASLLPGDGRIGLSGRRGRRHIAARGAVYLRLRLWAGTGHRRGWDAQRLRAGIERGVAITVEGVSQDLGQSGTGRSDGPSVVSASSRRLGRRRLAARRPAPAGWTAGGVRGRHAAARSGGELRGIAAARGQHGNARRRQQSRAAPGAAAARFRHGRIP